MHLTKDELEDLYKFVRRKSTIALDKKLNRTKKNQRFSKGI